ncbi:FAD:protein FMN transferase [Limnohabitans sp.]|uniref:FAD:protein FMN transferase n=1 Tax=Limnohabitans sp. TaxID=1907725 RepID=UPI002AFF4C39|nr:FAD:protein FMN transferase [Limnohabitans sp.]
MPVHRVPFAAMASTCEVVLSAPTLADAQRLAQPGIDEVLRVERTFSRYRPDSIVSRINAAAGADWVDCDAETLSLLDFADHMHQQSGGVFDITSGVLRQAWNFGQTKTQGEVQGEGPAAAKLPSPEQLAALLPLVGWAQVQREGTRIRLPRAGMALDFGGFGKEYAADRAAALLQQTGVQHGYVNLGGDMRLMGPKPDGAPWVMGIQHPRERGQLLATQQLTTGGLATSGDYERYIEVGGQRYCHLLNPRTGWPVSHWRTVSVTAPLAVLAGCVATIAMLLEADGLAFLHRSGHPFIAVDHTGQLFTDRPEGGAPTKASPVGAAPPPRMPFAPPATADAPTQ